MLLWLIRQIKTDWDEYEFAIVVADDADTAKGINPRSLDQPGWATPEYWTPDRLESQVIGAALPGVVVPHLIAASMKRG